MNRVSKPSMLTALARGAMRRCPACGESTLFKSYVKQVDACARCGTPFGGFRADDGPAWLTVLLTGHIIAPLMLTLVQHTDLPEWQLITGVVALAALLVAVILPRAKGLFIAIMWKMKKA